MGWKQRPSGHFRHEAVGQPTQEAIEGIGHHRWTLDEKKDYEMISAVFSHFVNEGKEDFVTEDIIEFLDNHPEIVAINQDIGRNEGLAKSIREDKIVYSVD